MIRLNDKTWYKYFMKAITFCLIIELNPKVVWFLVVSS